MFLYQSETDSHFECPQCGQHGSVPTAHLDDVLQRNKNAVISCTKCMTRFAPHAPTADRLRPTEPVHSKDIGTPQMAMEEAADEGSEDAPALVDKVALPELSEHWRHHANASDAANDAVNDVPNDPASALPLWLQPHSDRKD